MKRRRIENQFREGIINPPELTNFIAGESQNLTLTCPSKTSTEIHTQTLRFSGSDVQFSCDCGVAFGNNVQKCVHLNALLLSIVNKYIENYVDPMGSAAAEPSVAVRPPTERPVANISELQFAVRDLSRF